jgi:uncharacterized repeat protein (TIGR03803 family)
MQRIVGAVRKVNRAQRACAVFIFCATTAIALPAQILVTLHKFNGSNGGANPAGLIQATDGNFYGTAYNGGAHYLGTAFKITPDGMVTTLYSFCSQEVFPFCIDGSHPNAPLVQATNGDFYGTTFDGGAYNAGSIFKIGPSGKLTTLHTFCSQSGCADGAYPWTALVQARDGDLYGVTSGDNAGTPWTFFKITPGGALTTLNSFCPQAGCPQGNGPEGIIQASDGDFYGTTVDGGAYGYGTIFKIAPSGTLSTLYSFCAQGVCTDGAYPAAGLVQGSDGDLYGTTLGGYGGNLGWGTVFKITPGGTLTTLYSFCAQSGCADGARPLAALVQATDGNFYGTTVYGGTAHRSYGDGTAFEITPCGTLTTLYSFCSENRCEDGLYPGTPLLQDTNGDFYGTTGGGKGTVFSLSAGLGPFVKTQPTLGKAGMPVKILGTALTGATRVTFNGVPAVFEVLSGSEIKAAVPARATSGKVQVVTPNGTLSSNVPFQVLP